MAKYRFTILLLTYKATVPALFLCVDSTFPLYLFRLFCFVYIFLSLSGPKSLPLYLSLSSSFSFSLFFYLPLLFPLDFRFSSLFPKNLTPKFVWIFFYRRRLSELKMYKRKNCSDNKTRMKNIRMIIDNLQY